MTTTAATHRTITHDRNYLRMLDDSELIYRARFAPIDDDLTLVLAERLAAATDKLEGLREIDDLKEELTDLRDERDELVNEVQSLRGDIDTLNIEIEQYRSSDA